jgi:hypothetical protein
MDISYPSLKKSVHTPQLGGKIIDVLKRVGGLVGLRGVESGAECLATPPPSALRVAGS